MIIVVVFDCRIHSIAWHQVRCASCQGNGNLISLQDRPPRRGNNPILPNDSLGGDYCPHLWWSKTEADLVDIAKISEAKWRAHSSGCKEAWDDFASLMVYEFSCDGNISIVAALDLEEMSGGLSRWVWRGFSGTFSPQNVA